MKEELTDDEVLRFINLVGKSGIGKTTLCKLIVRFYDTQEGEILLDGTNIKEISISSLRKSILLTLQNDYVFNGTIWENITYGVESADESRVFGASREAGLDFVDKFPDGYHTLVGVTEKGEIVETGDPRELLSNKNSLLSKNYLSLLGGN